MSSSPVFHCFSSAKPKSSFGKTKKNVFWDFRLWVFFFAGEGGAGGLLTKFVGFGGSRYQAVHSCGEVLMRADKTSPKSVEKKLCGAWGAGPRSPALTHLVRLGGRCRCHIHNSSATAVLFLLPPNDARGASNWKNPCVEFRFLP